MVNMNGFGTKLPWPNEGIILAFIWIILTKPQEFHLQGKIHLGGNVPDSSYSYFISILILLLCFCCCCCCHHHRLLSQAVSPWYFS